MCYKQVCETCGSIEVARLKWVNVNDDKTLYDGDSGTTLEWCFGKCSSETNIVDEADFKVWQPEFDGNGDILGHEGESIFSFEVYSSKEKLLEDYPNCNPISYNHGDIEGFTIIE